MTHDTSEKKLKECIDVLGDDFGTAFFYAQALWVDISLTWQQFENLFGHGKERIQLLNKSGGSFFFLVDRYFFEAVLLAICRLSDPVKTAGKSNLSIHLFAQFMDTESRLSAMEKLLKDVNSTSGFARDWRNRRISHNDYNLIAGNAEPLQDATRNSVNAALSALHATINYVSVEFFDSHLHDRVLDHLNNEMVLLNRLFLGNKTWESDLEQLKKGVYIAENLPSWLSND